MKNLIKNVKNFCNQCFEDKDYKKEIARRLFHILTILILPLIYIFLTKKQILFIVLPFLLIVIVADFYRYKFDLIGRIFNFLFGHILKEEELENDTWTSVSYIFVSAIIVFIICPKIIAICAFTILGVSDGLAILVGKKIANKTFFEKSMEGSLVFGISAFIVLIICGFLSKQGFGYYFFGSFAVLISTIIDARPSFFDVDNNLAIPLSFSGIMLFFAAVWGFSY